MIITHIKKIITVCFFAALFFGYGFYYYYNRSNVIMYDYDEEKDSQQMIEMANQDYYWLYAGPREEFSFEYSLRYLAPNRYEKQHFGALKIKVLRQYDRVLGFVVYYMHNATKGQLLWLDVREETRGKGYGYMLAKYAVDQMVAAGARTIFLWTRTSNVPGQKIYRKLGFKEKYTTPEEIVYFEYKV